MRTALVAVFLAAVVSTAGANGRDPYTSSIHFKRGAEQNIVAGMTFGVVLSHDGGATWQWMCEKAVGYGGMYDPDYEYTASGAIFATTFDGLKVMRDGCNFASTPPGMTFVSRVEQGPNGTIYFAAADPNDAKIYKSTDDGVTFPTSANPGLPNDWWQSIEVAPSDPTRVYLTGYRLPMKCTQNSSNPGTPCTTNTDCPGGTCEPQKEFLLLKSVDSGATFVPMAQTGIGTTSPNSTIDIVGISSTNPNVIFVKVTLETGNSGDSIYRSTNGGTTWTKILSMSSNFGLAFLDRANGTCVAGTREMGAKTLASCETTTNFTWTDLPGAPHIGCLYENSAGEVWACTQNTAIPQLGIASDNYGIMKSTDLVTWTGLLKYQDIQAPVACAAGTVQNDQCIERYMDMQSPWCCLVSQIGITSTAIDCSGARGCFAPTVDGAVDAGTMVKPPPKGCCDAGSGSSALLGGLLASTLLFRRRRPSKRS